MATSCGLGDGYLCNDFFFRSLEKAREYASALFDVQGVVVAITSTGNWEPACNQTEEPFFTRTGRKLLYCWQPSTGRHAYLDCALDMILSDDEAREAIGY